MVNIKPLKYIIYLDIDFDKLSFNGNVLIKLDIDDNNKEIILDCEKLVVKSVNLNEINTNFKIDNNKLIISLDRNNIKNNNSILIKYSGKVTNDLFGIYYSNHGNSKIISTQFEPNGARRMFPCIDDPKFKAIFKVVLKSNSDKTFLSNMPINSEKIIGNNKLVIFDTTPLMSTYLLCIIIGDLEKVFENDLVSSNGIKINGYAVKNIVKNIKFSVIKTLEALEYYQKWFNIDYNLPKIDIVSIPEFGAGAMENWGLITYREELLFCNDDTNITDKIEIVNTIFHEMAHQWFGNLVTLNDWSSLWLNESFATIFSWISMLDKYQNEYFFKDAFYSKEFKHLIICDAFDSSHPILVKSNDEDYLKLIFDEISYQKGCCIVNYIIKLIGIKNFKLAIREYLNKYKFNNVSSKDLFDILEKYSTKNIHTLINKLITVKGYPIIIAHYSNNKLTLIKKKYNLLKKDIDKDENYDIDFYINYKFLDKKENLCKNEWIEFVGNKIEINLLDKDNIVINSDAVFPCIVFYENFKPNVEIMTNLDKIYYVDTNYLLFYNGYINLETLLINTLIIFNTLSINYDKINDEFYAYEIFIKNIIHLINILKKQDKIKKLNFYKDHLNKNYYKKLEKLLFICNNDKILYRENYINNILLLFCNYLNIQKYIDISFNLFNFGYEIGIKNNFENFYLDKSLFCIVAKHSNDGYFDKIKNIYDKTNNIVIQKVALVGLTHSNNKEKLKYLVDNYTKIKIKEQDIHKFFAGLINNNLISEYTMDKILIKNSPIFKLDEHVFIRFLRIISENIFNDKNIDKVLYFFKNLNKKEFTLKINQNIDILTWHKQLLNI
jgi:tricorn protease interacting factor F2/3